VYGFIYERRLHVRTQVRSPTQHFQLRETLRPACVQSIHIRSYTSRGSYIYHIHTYTCIYKTWIVYISYMNGVFIYERSLHIRTQVRSPTQHFQLRETLRPARVQYIHIRISTYTKIRISTYIRSVVDRICVYGFIYERSLHI